MRIATSILALSCASTLPTNERTILQRSGSTEIKEVIAAARELAEFVEDDEKFPAIKDMSSADQKPRMPKQRCSPSISPKKHRIDRYALGDLVIESNVQGGTQRNQGSAWLKISRVALLPLLMFCIRRPIREMSDKNKAGYNER
ncbi:MAG: hypothetical protein HT580_10695 [Dechloromonas sp.]|nr:MAG: hypothetical protein HT580_10695 [Dechloromonas sp.]